MAFLSYYAKCLIHIRQYNAGVYFEGKRNIENPSRGFARDQDTLLRVETLAVSTFPPPYQGGG